jgi:zinc transport system substrate-binding protein
MMKKKLVMFIIIALSITLTACNNSEADSTQKNQKDNSKIEIVASFHAIGEFAKAVGGNKVDVKVIVPDGTEPHDFEPKAMDIARMSEARLFVYNGLGMEAWADKVTASINSTELVKVDTSKDADLIANNKTDEINERGQYDPHLWLSLKGAQIQAKNIKVALEKVDPSNRDYYDKNYTEFYNKLEKLYNEYLGKFKVIKNKNFVTGHAAFAYLCRDFGLKQNSVENVFAEGEPSANRLRELVEYCKSNSIKVVFLEDMASPKISETLAREVNAKVEKIYTVESKENNLGYLESMTYNLEKIYESLK